MVDNLLREGANINLIDSNIMTPLAIAISDGKTEIAKCLLGRNFGIDFSLGQNLKLLPLCCESLNIEIFRILINFESCDINE